GRRIGRFPHEYAWRAACPPLGHMVSRRFVITLVAVVGLSTSRASLSEPKRLAHIDSDVSASTDAHPRVIVRYKAGAESSVQDKLKRRGHQPSHRFRRINAFA